MKCICEQCGKEYDVFLSDLKRKNKRFCCRKCYGLSLQGKKRNPEIYLKVSKKLSGRKLSLERRNEMSIYRRKNPQRYWLGKKRGSFSSETKLKMSLSQKSKQNKGRYNIGNIPWNYKGITPLTKLIRRSKEYLLWRSNVYMRDNWTCQTCGIKGVEFNAHHIIPFSKIIKDNKITSLEMARKVSSLWDIENGVTLCLSCHNLTKLGRLKK